MKKVGLQKISRITLGICALLLIAVLFFPLWRIDLVAPQYPEGLRLLIYTHQLAGDVDIINGLNHYIGMKTLHTKDFVEFSLLPYLVGFFALAFMVTALLNQREYLYLLFLLFICFGVVSMYDFWRWEYNYGHNLQPDAAIVIPGMSYQPPLIGFKQLLNFGAYSFPDIGGWIFILVGLITFLLVLIEWKKKINLSLKSLMLVLFLSGLISCNSGPEEIVIGTDHCSACKMRVTDPHFGAELVTGKGKVYKFDDVICLKNYLEQEKNIAVKNLYLSRYTSPHQLIEADKAVIVQDKSIRGPMGGNIAVFTRADSIIPALKNNGKTITWNQFMRQ
ncbi:MAG: nitrous oxide reductase accessory protein NosL [Bacteroidota bacterium]